MAALERLYQPEYVGENRCLPCTVVNLGIALVVAVTLVFLTSDVLIPTAFLVLSLVAIYFRGYLIPGTPELTKRYLPKRVLSWFGKAPDTTGTYSSTSESGDADLNVERLLTVADAIEPCETVSDVCLTDSFEQEWRERITTRRSTHPHGASALADALGVTEDSEIRVMEDGDSFVAINGLGTVAQWPSRAAAIADVAAAALLTRQSPDWTRLTPAERAAVLSSLRIFLDHCPACDGAVDAGEERVTSCCHSYQVLAIVCSECDSRLYEADMERFEAAQ